MSPFPWPALANHLWQSTFLGGLAAVLTFLLRRNRAQVRYRLWLAASLKFLLPFSLLISVGSQFEWRTVPDAAPPIAVAFEQIAEPFAPQPAPIAAPAPPRSPWMPWMLAAVWLSGCGIVLTRWWLRWRHVRSAVKAASPLALTVPGGAPIAVKSSPMRLEPGVFGVLRPVLLLPDGMAEGLTPAQFQAILAHEICHVRRRDNLTAALHMAVAAIFWFHPLVWWIGMRLVEERERACDEEVLRLGSEAEVYATGILKVCKLYLESPLACASGVTGADLKKRIEAIMTNRSGVRMTLGRKLLVAGMGVAAVAGPIVIGVVNLPQGRAQEQGATPLRFEVASIKPSKSVGGRGGLESLPGGGLRLTGMTVKDLMVLAYDVRDSQISGGPSWVRSAAYDVVAKPEHPDLADPRRVAPGTAAWNRMEQRLQALLAERCHLVMHRVSKEGSVYALVVAKGGSKLQPTPDEEQGPPRTMRSPGRIDAQNGTMHMLANLLTNWLGRPVMDQTGLGGTYTYRVEYAQEPGGSPGRGGPGEAAADFNPDISGPSIYRALQDQLGLKLEATKGAIETIVIDRVEKPSAN